MNTRSFLCYARGGGNRWEAICVDLDIAVEGRSLPDVMNTLKTAIQTYVEDANREAPSARERLLSRRSPWHVRAKWAAGLLVHTLRGNGDDKGDARFNVPCHA